MSDSIALIECARVALIYIHLIASMFAVSSVLSADVRLLFGKLKRQHLRFTVDTVAYSLVVLWFTGLTLVWLDTGFAPAEMVLRSKLLLKLVVVSILTLNGLILHWLSFPVLLSKNALSHRAIVLLAVTGSISTASWLLAALIGVAEPLARFPIQYLLQGYLLLMTATVLVSLTCIPIFRNRLLSWRQSSSALLSGTNQQGEVSCRHFNLS